MVDESTNIGIPSEQEISPVLAKAKEIAGDYLSGLGERSVAADPTLFQASAFPETGLGGKGALAAFEERHVALMSGSPGPRYFAFVTGGVTPAALAGDWLTAAFDQNALLTGETGAPMIEEETLGFLKELLSIPNTFTGVFLSGATVSNFTGLSIARQALLKDAGIDAAEVGLWQAPPIPVLSAAPHASILKALSMAGMGRASVSPVSPLPGREAIDVEALEVALRALEGSLAIVVANAGTVNTADYDDLEAIGHLKKKYPFWLHVDGAFGAFAACSPKFSHLMKGIGEADSITVDGHKWLNVPYDSAMLFTRHPQAQMDVFRNQASYLSPSDLGPRNYIHMVPENSRRFRALPAWMSLQAYGRSGYRELVERCCDCAHFLGALIDIDPRFTLVTPVRLNVVAFELSGPAASVDGAVGKFLQKLNQDGEVFLSSSSLDGRPMIRVAVSNWRTRRPDMQRSFEAFGAAFDAVFGEANLRRG